MGTVKDIKKTEQQIAALSLKMASAKMKQRKSETRKKIQYGGLVLKSKMDSYPKDVILGALISAFQELGSSDEVKHVFELKGKQAFLEKDDGTDS